MTTKEQPPSRIFHVFFCILIIVVGVGLSIRMNLRILASQRTPAGTFVLSLEEPGLDGDAYRIPFSLENLASTDIPPDGFELDLYIDDKPVVEGTLFSDIPAKWTGSGAFSVPKESLPPGEYILTAVIRRKAKPGRPLPHPVHGVDSRRWTISEDGGTLYE